jgi:hypothetical protein
LVIASNLFDRLMIDCRHTLKVGDGGAHVFGVLYSDIYIGSQCREPITGLADPQHGPHVCAPKSVDVAFRQPIFRTEIHIETSPYLPSTLLWCRKASSPCVRPSSVISRLDPCCTTQLRLVVPDIGRCNIAPALDRQKLHADPGGLRITSSPTALSSH